MKTIYCLALILASLFLSSSSTPIQYVSVTPNFFAQRDWINITSTFTSFPTKGFLNESQVTNYLKEVHTNFPDIVLRLETLGHTVQKRDIHAIVFGLKGIESSHNKDKVEKPKVLITSFLYGTDFISTAMTIHLMNYLLYGYVHKDPNALYLLENREIWIIPIVNVDAYSFVTAHIAKEQRTTLILKNRRDNDPDNLCGESIGVDLNRNFDVNFDKIEGPFGPQTLEITKSPDYVCKPYYKGIKSFSEPETEAIKNLLDKEPFKIGINLLGVGTRFLIPYSHSNDIDNLELEQRDLYMTIQDECPFPKGTKFGTKYQVLGQIQNGEISDYMLQKKSIIAGSYSIGIAEPGYESNFPIQSKSIRILEENLESMLYFIQKAGINLRIREDKQGRCNKKLPECQGLTGASYYFQFNVSNSGLQDQKEKIILLFSFSSEDLYQLQQVSIMSNQKERKSLSFNSVNVQNGTIGEIEIPPLSKGDSLLISTVFIRTSSSFLGHYSSIPSDEPQFISLRIKDFPKTKLSHSQSVILEPNFDINEYEERQRFQRKIIITAIAVLLIVGGVIALAFMIARCLKKKSASTVKFVKLEDSSKSTAIDHEGATVFDPTINIKPKTKAKVSELELADRASRSKKKEKREKSKKRSEDRVKSSSPEGSEERKEDRKKKGSRDKKSKEKRKSSVDKEGVKKREKNKNEKNEEFSPEKETWKKRG